MRRQDTGQGIHFDFAISAKAESIGKGIAKFKLFVVDADFKTGGGVSKEVSSRIKFSVFVVQRIGGHLSKDRGQGDINP